MVNNPAPGPGTAFGRRGKDEYPAALRLREKIATIPDPEIPVITIEELGVLRDVVVEGGRATVTITPTYSGCPAMDHIRDQIEQVVEAEGFEVEVRLVYQPCWTTDWLSDEAKRKLAEFGIAPPAGRSGRPPTAPIVCPQCGGGSTSEVSRFGSTACKALMVCDSCAEPFDYFKVH